MERVSPCLPFLPRALSRSGITPLRPAAAEAGTLSLLRGWKRDLEIDRPLRRPQVPGGCDRIASPAPPPFNERRRKSLGSDQTSEFQRLQVALKVRVVARPPPATARTKSARRSDPIRDNFFKSRFRRVKRHARGGRRGCRSAQPQLQALNARAAAPRTSRRRPAHGCAVLGAQGAGCSRTCCGPARYVLRRSPTAPATFLPPR